MTTPMSLLLLLPAMLCPEVVSVSATTRLFSRASSTGRRSNAAGAASAFLLRAAEVPQSSIARTLATLDSNADGVVTPDEIKKFALLQGLDGAAVVEEFSGLDSNGDGTLDAKEIAAVLNAESGEVPDTAPLQAEASVAKEAPSPPQITTPEDVIPQPAPQSAKTTKDDVAAQPFSKLRGISGEATAQSLSETTQASTQAESAATTAESEETTAATRAKAAAQIVSLVNEEEEQMREAEKSERLAAEVRANSTAIAKSAEQEALVASSDAASKKAQEILGEVNSLLSQAKVYEVKAAKLRAESKAELQGADTFMNVANAAISHGVSDKQEA